jgi:hypothetical protein
LLWNRPRLKKKNLLSFFLFSFFLLFLSLIHSLSHSLTVSLIHILTHTLSFTVTHTLTLFAFSSSSSFFGGPWDRDRQWESKR